MPVVVSDGVLLVDGVEHELSIDELQKLPSVVACAEFFTGSMPVNASGVDSLCVWQREAAIGVPTNRFAYIGTQEATTCHIVAVCSDDGSRVSVAHLDSVGASEVTQQLVAAAQSEYVTVYVAGGYSGEAESYELSSTILDALAHCNAVVTIGLWCVGELNTTLGSSGETVPKVMAAAFDTAASRLVPAVFAPGAHYPEAPLRTAFVFSDYPCRSVYNVETDELEFTDVKFPLVQINWQDLPDEVMLQYFSTSPTVESDTFCDDLRAAFHFIDTYRHFSNYGPRTYRRLPPTFEWKMVSGPNNAGGVATSTTTTTTTTTVATSTTATTTATTATAEDVSMTGDCDVNMTSALNSGPTSSPTVGQGRGGVVLPVTVDMIAASLDAAAVAEGEFDSEADSDEYDEDDDSVLYDPAAGLAVGLPPGAGGATAPTTTPTAIAVDVEMDG